VYGQCTVNERALRGKEEAGKTDDMSNLIIYTSDDGQKRINLRVEADSVWLPQQEIAELFQATKQNVSLHAKNIFDDGELSPAATVKESLTVQTEGSRQVQRAGRLAKRLLGQPRGHAAHRSRPIRHVRSTPPY